MLCNPMKALLNQRCLNQWSFMSRVADGLWLAESTFVGYGPCHTFIESWSQGVLRTVRVVIQPESSGCVQSRTPSSSAKYLLTNSFYSCYVVNAQGFTVSIFHYLSFLLRYILYSDVEYVLTNKVKPFLTCTDATTLTSFFKADGSLCCL